MEATRSRRIDEVRGRSLLSPLLRSELRRVQARERAVGGHQLGVGALLDDSARRRRRRLRSASRTVDSLWAMMSDVRPVRMLRSPRWMSTSVRVSTDEVASSRIRIAGSPTIARANAISCRWPVESVAPRSSTCVSNPSGRRGDERRWRRRARRLPNVVVGGLERSVADVVGDGAREEERVLEHDPEVARSDAECQVAEVDAVDEHGPARRVVEAWDEVDDRRLAGAGRPDDGECRRRPRPRDRCRGGSRGPSRRRSDAASSMRPVARDKLDRAPAARSRRPGCRAAAKTRSPPASADCVSEYSDESWLTELKNCRA